jgi:hypothetical protein
MHRPLLLFGLALALAVWSPASAKLVLTPAASGDAAATAEQVEVRREPRVISLVVGNRDYREFPALDNTANDARDVAALFSLLGHHVTVVIEGDRATVVAMLEEVRQLILP